MTDAAPLLGTEYSTPFGTLAVLVAPETGAVRASAFTSLPELIGRLPAALAAREVLDGAHPVVTAAVRAWLAGDADALLPVPVEQDGGAFFQRVWAAMRGIPGGTTATYGELAAAAGNPKAARAAGTACATNAVAPFVPCHRVVASTGMGNYGYGVATKAAMLRMEGVRV
jgi:methylated-DNA-[protein]-cysteine S-methyltransferase